MGSRCTSRCRGGTHHHTRSALVGSAEQGPQTCGGFGDCAHGRRPLCLPSSSLPTRQSRPRRATRPGDTCVGEATPCLWEQYR